MRHHLLHEPGLLKNHCGPRRLTIASWQRITTRLTRFGASATIGLSLTHGSICVYTLTQSWYHVCTPLYPSQLTELYLQPADQDAFNDGARAIRRNAKHLYIVDCDFRSLLAVDLPGRVHFKTVPPILQHIQVLPLLVRPRDNALLCVVVPDYKRSARKVPSPYTLFGLLCVTLRVANLVLHLRERGITEQVICVTHAVHVRVRLCRSQKCSNTGLIWLARRVVPSALGLRDSEMQG